MKVTSRKRRCLSSPTQFGCAIEAGALFVYYRLNVVPGSCRFVFDTATPQDPHR